MKRLKNKIRQSAGFTLVEIMITTLIVVSMTGGIFMVFSVGQASWFNTDAQIQLQQDLRQTMQRISSELRQSKENTNAADDHVDISDGSTDVLKFSIPIICAAGGNFIDPATEAIENWGAPLNWGCSSVGCMDQDGDCAFLEYKFIQYSIDNDNNLIREVWDENNVLKKSEVFAQDITDFQVTMSGDDTDGYMYTISVSTQKDALTGRTVTAQASINVFLRN